MLKNKKAQETGTPINTIVMLVIIVLVIAGIFYLIIRAELTKKFEELPGPSEREEEVTVEVAEICPIESGGIVTFVNIQRSMLRLDFLASDIIKHLLCSGNTIDSCPCSLTRAKQCEIGNYLHLQDGKVWLNKNNRGDIEIGVITDYYGTNKIKIYCDYFNESSKAYQDVKNILPSRQELFMYNNACYGGASVGGIWKLHKDKAEADTGGEPEGCAIK